MFPLIQICLLLSLLVLTHASKGYSTHRNYAYNFYVKTMGCSCLLGDKYKFTANVRDQDHKNAKKHYFVA